MPLHENLERRRRQKIAEYHVTGACQLCECTSGSRSFRRFVGDDDGGKNCDVIRKEDYICKDTQEEVPSISANNAPPTEDEEVADVGVPPMRTCACYGNSSWPYPLRVCEMCIADDLTTGRIRHCAICGVVACDEDCGAVELAEATDREEWNNAGCLECRGMESFGEMELFRSGPRPNGIPRATRVCLDCVELFSLFSFGTRYHFQCRYFKCERMLVPSHVVELKRFVKPFPLSRLPEELMNSIVDFLGGKDLFSFGSVCTSTFRKVEQVAMEVVTRHGGELPTGPTQIVQSDRKNRRTTVHAEGKNDNPLRPPEDGKSWVGVLNQMERLTRDIFYFDFQIKGGDDGAAMRYLRRRDKLGFDRVLSKGAAASPIAPYSETGNFSVRGGQVLVTKYKWHHGSLLGEPEDRNAVRSVIFSTDRVLASGIHRVIVRYCCFCEGESLGSIGILREKSTLEGPVVTWAQSSSIVCQGRMEEHVFGMEYDADRRTLQMYKKNGKTNRMESTTSGGAQAVPDEGGALRFAAALSAGSAGIKGNQLSVRACGEGEWSAFLAHAAERNVVPRIRGRGQRGEERLMRYLDHRARRMIAEVDGGNDIAARVEVEHMMDMFMEDEMEALNGDDSDSELEDAMQFEGGDAPAILPPDVAAAADLPGRA